MPNFRVLCDALALRILTEVQEDGSVKANGVEFEHSGSVHTVRINKEVVLSAG